MEQQTLDDRFSKFADQAEGDQTLDDRFSKFATASVSDRHNNPLNIKYGPLTKQYVADGSAEIGEAATDGGQFLRFESPDSGYSAGHKLLLSPAYKDLTVEAAMKKWSNGGYGASVAPSLSPSAKVSDLGLDDRQRLLEAMAKREGYTGAIAESDHLTPDDHAALSGVRPASLINLPHAEQIGANNAFERSIKPSTSQPPSFAETAAKLQEPISKKILGFSLSDVADKFFPDLPNPKTPPTLASETVRRTAKTLAGFMDFLQSPEALTAALAEAVTAGGATPVIAGLMGGQFVTQGGKEATHALDDMRTNGITPENSEQFFGGLAIGVGGMIGPAAVRDASIRAKAAAAKALENKDAIHDAVQSALQDHVATLQGTVGAIDSQRDLTSQEASETTATPPAEETTAPAAEAPAADQPAIQEPAENAPIEERFAAQEPLEERFAHQEPQDDDTYLQMADEAPTELSPEIAKTLVEKVDQINNSPVRSKAPELVRDSEFERFSKDIRNAYSIVASDKLPDVDDAISLWDEGNKGEAIMQLEYLKERLHELGRQNVEKAAQNAGIEIPPETATPEEQPVAAVDNPVDKEQEPSPVAHMTREEQRAHIIRGGAEQEMVAWAQSVRDAQDQLKRGESAQTLESNAAGKEIEEQAGAKASAIRSLGVKEGSPLEGLKASPDELAELIENADRGKLPKPGTKRAELLEKIQKAFADSYEEAHGESIDSHLDSLSEAREPEGDTDTAFDFGNEAGKSPALDAFVHKLADAYDKIREYVTLDAIPLLTRDGAGPEAVAHATARAAVPHMIRDFLAQVFPDDFKKPKEMERVMRVMVLDNILGAYDKFKEDAAFAWQRGDEAAMDTALNLAEDAAQRHDLKAYEKEVKAAALDPKIASAIDRWKKIVNPAMDKLYNVVKGMDPATPRDGRGRIFGARVNLLAKEHVPDWLAATVNEEKPVPEGASLPSIANPLTRKDRFDRRTKLTAEEYSEDPVATLASMLFPRYNEATKLQFYKALIDSNTAKWDARPATGTVGGGREATSLKVKVPETKNGNTRMVERTMWVPKELDSEIQGVLGIGVPLKGNIIGRALNALQLAQFADATAHLKNIHGVIAAAQGLKSFMGDIARKFPGISSVDAFTRIGKVMYEVYQDKPAIRSEMADMAKQGMIRQSFPPTGFQKITHMTQLIHSVDTASRVIMNRFYGNLIDRGLAVDSPLARRKFVQQIGEYNRRLMGPLQRAATQSGLSPFIVAGRNFNRYSRRLLTGNPGFEATSMKAAMQARLVNFTTLGSMMALPAMYNLLKTGSVTGRAGTPLGAIDLGMPEDQKGNHKVFDLWQLYGMRRGARSLGIDAIANGMINHQRANDIVGTAISDSTNSALHPWIGPAAGFVFSALTGTKLDMRGGPMPEEAAKMEGKGSQYLENLRVAAKNQNLFLYSPLRKAFGDVEKTPAKDFLNDFLKSPASAVGISDRPSPAIQAAHESSLRVPTTPAQREKSQLRRQILAAYDAGDESAAQKLRADSRGKLSQGDLTELARERRMTPIERATWREPLEAVVKVWTLATPEERKSLRRVLATKVANANRTTTGLDQARSILRAPVP